ncbi:serine dehydratase subunit alpha family protein [Clostridium oceanicum]|uniref:UPF0597 protein GCM10008906_26510 n=1 Tax=Clostridium oceanicum TaxID=1543 RepID=A0ABN1JN68_9CLOT
MRKNVIIDILKREMAPGLGVTEPAALSLASSKAYETIGGNIISIKVITDRGLFKNGFSCSIPGTLEKGNKMSILLGITGGNSNLGLKVLNDITKEDIDKAKKLSKEDIVKFSIKEHSEGLYIECIVNTDKGYSKVIIEGSHDNIVLIEKNNKTIFRKERKETKDKECSKLGSITTMTVKDMLEFVESVDLKDIDFLLKGADMNKKLAFEGFKGKGIGLGKLLIDNAKSNGTLENPEVYGEILTASAVDARVGGVKLPAMTITGSGNHGIISTMPILAVYEKEKLSKEKLAKSIALSYLVNMYIKEYSGKLSAFCGCAVAAGTGASAGITYILGGNLKQIEDSIKNMLSNITGIICTGGNEACSLKANSGVKSAFLSSKMALSNIAVPSSCGIASDSVENMMANVGKIAYPGMVETDKEILNIMVNNS